MMNDKNQKIKATRLSRYRVLVEIKSIMDIPIALLGLVWLILIIIDLTSGLSDNLMLLNYFIWVVFIVDFLVGFIIAPSKFLYFKRNWLVAISVLLPAFGILRFFKVFNSFKILSMVQFTRSLNFLRLVTSSRKGIRSLKKTLKTNALGSVIATTFILILVGAAGLVHFENPQSLESAGYDGSTGITSYADALWWTSMIITTIGTNYWPVSIEGRIITFIIALYAISFFGYIAANLASHFIKSDEK